MDKDYCYYTYDDGYEIADLECKTYEDAYKKAEDSFAEECLEENPRNNEEFSKTISILKYYSVGGEDQPVVSTPDEVFYTHYHGDLEEHGTYWNI